MASYNTRSRARKPDDDVEPDLPLDSPSVRPQVEATGQYEPMSAEPAEPVSALIHLSVGLPPSEGGSGVPGPADSHSMGVSLGYPSGQAGPLQIETQVKGLMLTPQPDIEISTSHSAVALCGSGIIDPDFGASAAAAGEALPATAAGTQQQTRHTRHSRTPRQAPATETPAAEGLTIAPKIVRTNLRRTSRHDCHD